MSRPIPHDPSEMTAAEGQAVERAELRITDAIIDDTLKLMDLFDEMLRLCCVGTDQAPYNMRQWAEFNGDRIEDAAREIARRRYQDRPSEEEIQNEMRGDPK